VVRSNALLVAGAIDNSVAVILRSSGQKPSNEGSVSDRTRTESRMTRCQCQAIDNLFDAKVARRDLARFRRRGPDRSTRVLLEELQRAGLGGTLLDVGGGVGTIHHVLLDLGVTSATHVDASNAYLVAAREETQSRNHADRVQFVEGDFTDLAATIDPVDVVTLDKVLCCYDDMETLMRESAKHATRMCGLVYPRDVWWVRMTTWVMNAVFRIRRMTFRIFVHATADVERIARREGLDAGRTRRLLFWQVVVYTRQPRANS
jgi:2-polyprenyl-3-methyl-5-hydroxy-6-metoxy-1,4-benzoquinol methylase